MKRIGKVSAVCLLLLIAIFWTFTLAYNVRAVPRDKRTFRTISMTAGVGATADQMFTVTGGSIEIVSLFGECTVNMAGSPGNMSIVLDATTTANDRDFSTVVSINALGDGDVVRFSSTINEGVPDITSAVAAGQTLSWFCSPGEIEQKTASTGSSGNIKWYMTYRRLANASRVVISSE